MNWSARGNVLNQYLRNTSIGTTVKMPLRDKCLETRDTIPYRCTFTCTHMFTFQDLILQYLTIYLMGIVHGALELDNWPL
jgi:hypothetical protein